MRDVARGCIGTRPLHCLHGHLDDIDRDKFDLDKFDRVFTVCVCCERGVTCWGGVVR